MRIFTCEKNFESMMTCVFNAWEYALQVGHENIKLQLEPIDQPTLFDDYVHVKADAEKAQRVTNSIIKNISNAAYVFVYYASIYEEDTLDDIYRFLVLGFKHKSKVVSMMAEPAVMKMVELKRKVGNEIHYFREFARFNSIDNKVYVCHLEPKSDVIYLVGLHFADRMPSEHWMIIDDNRKYAVVHLANGEIYTTALSDAEIEKLKHSEFYADPYRVLWNVFFDSIGIKERKNEKCQRNMFPVWMRKHAVEFMR